ncbi:MAG: disulfide bond formation protein DsbA [Bacteroidetes bacterium]|nr:disulfide bond formation protein DsbA [Bacteroidota bacterium]
MKVEIWSDIMCPFCYIGKRKFEKALEQFEHKAGVEITWKSFQLNPDMKTDPEMNINRYLAEMKGWSLEQAKEMNARVTQMAEAVGLKYDFDKAVVANSFDAHRLIQLAKTKGKGDEAEERLFKAYFTEGSNIADKETLIEIGESIGLEKAEVKEMLDSGKFAENVQEDINESQQVGVRGVPFFVFDRKYAVSGAQESDAFLEVLRKASEA